MFMKGQSETWKTSQSLLKNCLCVPFAPFSSLDAYQLGCNLDEKSVREN